MHVFYLSLLITNEILISLTMGILSPKKYILVDLCLIFTVIPFPLLNWWYSWTALSTRLINVEEIFIFTKLLVVCHLLLLYTSIQFSMQWGYIIELWFGIFVSQAANYLNIKGLLDLTCQAVADMMKGKTAEEIRKTFNIKNDLTAEKEKEVRREYQWAFKWRISLWIGCYYYCVYILIF